MPRTIFIPDRDTLDADTECRVIISGRDRSSQQGMATLASLPTSDADHTMVVIPISRIAFIDALLPRVSAEKRAQLVNFAIEDKLTIDPATVHAIIIGPSLTGPNRYIIAAVSRLWLMAILRSLAQQGIVPTVVVAESALYQVGSGEWQVVLDGNRGIAIRADGQSYTLDAADHAEPPFQLMLALNEAVGAESGMATPATIRITTMPTDQTIDLARWQQQIGNQVQLLLAPPATQAGLPGNVSVNHFKSVNFLVGALLPASHAATAINALKPAWILAFSIVLLHLVFIGIDAWRLDHTRRAIELSMRQIFQTSFPDATTIVDPALQMSRNLNRIKTERGLNTDAVRHALVIAATLTKTLPADLAATMTNVASTAAAADAPAAVSITFKKLTTDQRQQLQAAVAAIRIGTDGNTFKLVPSGDHDQITMRLGGQP